MEPAQATTTRVSALDTALHIIAAVTGLLGLGTLALTIAGRIGSPWPLEWMEGGVLEHVLRLAQGQAIYGPPTADFVPYLYPPLAYLPHAALATVGLSSLPMQRSISLLWLALTLVAVGRIAARDAASPLAGWVAAGMFALGYGYTGAFLDLLRVDGLFITLMTWAVERLHNSRARTGLWLLAASALAKQHGLLLFLAASAALSLRDRHSAPRVVAPPLLALGSALWLLHGFTHGWFVRYVFVLPASHGVVWPLVLSFVLVDLLLYLPVLSISAFLLCKRNLRDLPPALVTLVAAFIVSALGRAHPGGDDNVRLPAFALLCGLALAPLLRTMLSSHARRSTRLWLAACLLGQAAMIWQPPSLYRPTSANTAQFSTLRATLLRCASTPDSSGANGAVALDFPLLTDTPFVHTMALSDLSLGKGIPALAQQARQDLLSRLSSEHAPPALAVGNTFPELETVLKSHYEKCAVLASPAMPTGYQPPAQHIYRHRASYKSR